MPKELGTLVLSATTVPPLGAYSVSGDGYEGGPFVLNIETPQAFVQVHLGFLTGSFSVDINADGVTGTYHHHIGDQSRNRERVVSPVVDLEVA